MNRRNEGNTEILTRRTRDFHRWFNSFEKFVEEEGLFEDKTPIQNTSTFLMYVDVNIRDLLIILCEGEDKTISSSSYPELKKLLIDHVNAINGRI